jgi:hypothetical protein
MKLTTWNIWGMILKNPLCYKNPIMAIQNTINDIEKTRELQVISIQECWVWRAGIFGWIPYNVLSALPNIVLVFMHIISLVFTNLFACKNYNPMDYVDTSKLNLHTYQNTSINTMNLMNSGLLMISNIEADEDGFIEFTDQIGLERLSSKGFQYIYYEDIDTIVINTHMQSGDNIGVKRRQIEQILSFLSTLDVDSIYVNGDFNLNTNNIIDKHTLDILKLEGLNGIEPTTLEGETFDHCLTNRISTYEYSISKSDNISDHYKLVFSINNDFVI